MIDERERQRQRQSTRRNERNKLWQKRIKIYYVVAFGTLLLEFLLFCGFYMEKTHSMIWLYVMGALFVIWFLWVVAGYIVLTCPHCDRHISHIAIGIECCPYCGTSLKVFADLSSDDDKEQ